MVPIAIGVRVRSGGAHRDLAAIGEDAEEEVEWEDQDSSDKI